MTILANPAVVAVRNRLRGITPLLALYRRWALNRMRSRPYEDRFGKELDRALRMGSVVWDVGANIGVYSRRFLTRGVRQVVCVEPAPDAVATLQREFADDARVTILPLALSDTAGSSAFVANGASGGNRLGDGDITVRTARADELIANEGLSPPDLLKIDVEGYELEVLKGFGSLLQLPTLQSVFVEVHFTLLHQRGLDTAPKAIERMLRDAGFDVRWIDLSHLGAYRSLH